MPSSTSLLIRRAHILLPSGEFLMGDVQIQGREIVQVEATIQPAPLENAAGEALPPVRVIGGRASRSAFLARSQKREASQIILYLK